MNDLRLVWIEWEDSFGCSTDWRSIDGVQANRPVLCQSVGWVIEHEDRVTIIPHRTDGNVEYATEPQGCGDMTIPKSAIRGMMLVELKPMSRARAATAKVIRNPKSSKKSKTKAGLALTQRIRKTHD